MNSEDKIKKDNFMNKKANNLIESENEKLMSPEKSSEFPSLRKAEPDK